MTIDTSIISIPNGMISNMSLTNLGLRESRLFNIMISVTYGTSPDTIDAFIQELRKLIEEHDKTKSEPYYVHLRELADSSINIMFRCYLTVPTFAEEAVIKSSFLGRLKVPPHIGSWRREGADGPVLLEFDAKGGYIETQGDQQTKGPYAVYEDEILM